MAGSKSNDEAKEKEVLDTSKNETAPESTQAPEADTTQAETEKPKAPAKPAAKPKVDEDQVKRDAHFYENGVKADGTGGVAPETE